MHTLLLNPKGLQEIYAVKRIKENYRLKKFFSLLFFLYRIFGSNAKKYFIHIVLNFVIAINNMSVILN